MKSRTLQLTFLAMLCGALAGHVWLNAYSFGRMAFAQQRYQAARVWYGVAAFSGNPKAQNNLAGLHLSGVGGPANASTAARWYERAAAQGVTEAKFNLSNLYEEGRGVRLNTTKAADWLQSAADDGDVVAAFNLGILHASGRTDFPRNFALAHYWYPMKTFRSLVLLPLLSIGGCIDLSGPVEVRINADAYRIGSIESPLATPAVDEVVRMKPKKVLIVACPGTPPTKIIQFEIELRARHQGLLQMTFADQACSNA